MNAQLKKLLEAATAPEPWNKVVWVAALRVKLCDCPSGECSSEEHRQMHVRAFMKLARYFKTYEDFEEHLHNASESDFLTELSAPVRLQRVFGAQILRKEVLPLECLPCQLKGLPPIYAHSILLISDPENDHWSFPMLRDHPILRLLE